MTVDKQKIARRLRAANWAAIATLTVILAINASDLVEYLRAPVSYPIGAEAAGVRYATKSIFLGTTIGMIAICSIGVGAGMFPLRQSYRTALRLAIALCLTVTTALLALSPG